MPSQLSKKKLTNALATMPVYPPPDPAGASRNALTHWHSDSYHDYYDTVLAGDNLSVRIYHRDRQIFAVKRENGEGVPLTECDRADAQARTKHIELGVALRCGIPYRLKVPRWVRKHRTALSQISYRSKHADPPLYRQVFEAGCHVFALLRGQEFSRTTCYVISELKALDSCPRLTPYAADKGVTMSALKAYWTGEKSINRSVPNRYKANANGQQVLRKKTILERKKAVIDRLVDASAIEIEVGTLSIDTLVPSIDVGLHRWLMRCLSERGHELVANRFLSALCRMFVAPPQWAVWDEYLVGKGYAGISTYGTRTRLSYWTPTKRGKISCAKVVARQLLTREELGLDWDGTDL